jgi:beta-RFAP synthase
MIRVITPSRLHFGLLGFPAEAPPRPPRELADIYLPNERWFGGAGLMVEAPGVRVAVEPANAWSAEGALSERALECAHIFARTLPSEAVRPHRVVVEQCPAEHVGLGTGTQLALAVAKSLATSSGASRVGAIELARRTGRGRRSALGIHGFAQGGFLVEAGHCGQQTAAPLVARAAFPEAWRLVLVLPPWGKGLHGQRELEAFAQLGSRLKGTTDARCRLVLLGMLPALIECDLAGFGEALYEFNERVGQVFAPVQGGNYGSPRTEELVRYVRRQGVKGVGQSSWGPAVFAVVADAEQADDLARRLRQRFALEADEVLCVRASNHGATVEV